jgi:hypothetical protein
MIFKPGVSYPSDSTGPFIDLEGPVMSLEDKDDESDPDEEVCVSVLTEHGIIKGWTSRPPKVGYKATIRVYRIGGGWYPDFIIKGWESNES